MPVKSLDQLSNHVCQLVDELTAENNTAANETTPLLVGLSGGMDSTVLLHLLGSVCARFDKISITAIHVNHGVHENSDEWARFCQRICDQIKIPLVISRHKLGKVMSNREAQYRMLRYRVFREHLPEQGVLFTAHHQDDQAETVLFNLFRGAGLRGLRAMKQRVAFGKGWHIRPFLSVPHDLVLQYAQDHGLEWVDDPSNENIEYDRNYIRQCIMPVIARRWPAAAASISRAATNLAHCEQIIEEIGFEDMNHCTARVYHGVIDNAYLGVLDLNRLDALSQARRLNLLRQWVLAHSALNLSHDQLQRISQDLCDGADSGLFERNGYQIRAYKRCLYLMKSMPRAGVRIEKPVRENGHYIFKHLMLTIKLDACDRVTDSSKNHLALRFAARSGGETIRLNGLTRPLKSLYQQYSIPAWERDIIPLIYQGDALVAVPGVVVADNSSLRQVSVSKNAA